MSVGGTETPPESPRRWGTLTKQIVVFGGIAGAVWAVFRFSSVIPPVIIAVLLAYLLTPLVNGLRRLTRMPRWLALIIVYLLLLVVITMTPALVIPNLVRQFTALNVDLDAVTETLKGFLSHSINFFGLATITPSEYIDQFRSQLLTLIPNIASPFASGAWGVLVSVSSSLIWLIFILVVSFYLVKDSAQVGRYLRGLIPPPYRRESLRLLSEIGNVWDSFFRGQFVLGGVIAVVVAVVMSILGVRNAPMLGLVAGLLEVIPSFGPTIAAIPGILLALAWGSSTFPALNSLWFALIVAGAYMLIQSLENNLLVPRIIGRSVNLHPAVVLVGAVAGVLLGGILGVLLASPAIATLRILTRYAYRKVADLEPFDEAAEPPPGVMAGRRVAALIFDLEETLLAPAARPANRWAALARQIAPARLLGQVRRAVRRQTEQINEKRALALANVLHRAGMNDKANLIEARWSRLRRQRAEIAASPSNAPLPSLALPADVTLAYLSGRVKIALVSRRSKAEMVRLLAQEALDSLFDALVSSSDGEGAAAVATAMELLGCPPAECALIGGSSQSLAAARGAGALFIGVSGTNGARDELAGADLLVEKLADLKLRF